MAKKLKERLDKILKDIASDVKLGEKFGLRFNPEFLDYGDGEIDEATSELFERSMLDPSNPFHWQFLLSMVAGAIYPDRPGRSVYWDNDKEGRLFRDVVKARKASRALGKNVSIEQICKNLRANKLYEKISSETLQARFNIVLRKKRALAKQPNSPSSLKADLKWFSGR